MSAAAGGNVVAMPPRNSRQSLVASLRAFAEQAEQGKITGLALVALRPGDNPANPPTSYYQWTNSMALAGASMVLTRFVLEDIAADETEAPSWDAGA